MIKNIKNLAVILILILFVNLVPGGVAFGSASLETALNKTLNYLIHKRQNFAEKTIIFFVLKNKVMSLILN